MNRIEEERAEIKEKRAAAAEEIQDIYDDISKDTEERKKREEEL